MTTLTDLPAILGGTPVRSRDYPSWPIWDDHERDNLLSVPDAGGWWQGDGDVAATFAAEFADDHGARAPARIHAHAAEIAEADHTAACETAEGGS